MPLHIGYRLSLEYPLQVVYHIVPHGNNALKHTQVGLSRPCHPPNQHVSSFILPFTARGVTPCRFHCLCAIFFILLLPPSSYPNILVLLYCYLLYKEARKAMQSASTILRRLRLDSTSYDDRRRLM